MGATFTAFGAANTRHGRRMFTDKPQPRSTCLWQRADWPRWRFDDQFKATQRGTLDVTPWLDWFLACM